MSDPGSKNSGRGASGRGVQILLDAHGDLSPRYLNQIQPIKNSSIGGETSRSYEEQLNKSTDIQHVLNQF